MSILSGFEEVRRLADPASGLDGFLVVHSTRRGPAFGGVRIARYASDDEAREDALALARAMSRKAALADLPAGGGKIVLRDSEALDRPAAILRLGELLESMGGRFIAGPDLGFREEDSRALARATRFAHPMDEGDPDALADATARGVIAAARAALELAGCGRLRGARVAIQGLGKVGIRLACRLAAEGAEIAFSDVAPREPPVPARRVDPGALHREPCDLFAPCARGGLLTAERACEMRALAVVGCANNILASPEAGQVLHERGVFFVPDGISSAGALILGVCRYLGRDPEIDGRIEAIRDAARAVLEESRRTGRRPEEVALALAEERLGEEKNTPP
ncbi:MAG: Glu/Leu/Phe/Val dehydrogenase [Planctomycetes bacterium]|nr:Glu/Leu/Phe/Val dehydrogenase [Planctomycetota bacterium]